MHRRRRRCRRPAPRRSGTANATASSSRTSRTTIPRRSCRSKARRPASAGSCATCCAWAREVIGVADPLRFGRARGSALPLRRAERRRRHRAPTATRSACRTSAATSTSTSRSTTTCWSTSSRSGSSRSARSSIPTRRPRRVGWDIVLVGKGDRSQRIRRRVVLLAARSTTPTRRANKGAVQVPDPFLKNVIMRASYRVFAELRRAEASTAGFKDLGAGGFVGLQRGARARRAARARRSSSTASPLRKPTLPPAVIAIGETQERLCWIVPPSFTPRAAVRSTTRSSRCRAVARGAAAAIVGKVVTAERATSCAIAASVVMDVDSSSSPAACATTGRTTIALPHRRRRPRRRPTFAGSDGVRARARASRRLLARADLSSATTASCAARPRFRSAYADAGVIVSDSGRAARRRARRRRESALREDRPAARRRARGRSKRCATSSRSARGRSGFTDCLNFGDPTIPEQFGDVGRRGRRTCARRAPRWARRSSRAT